MTRQLLQGFVYLVLFSRLTAAGPDFPDYKLGETSTVQILAPVHLIVIDHERTEKLRQEQMQRTPAIFRFDASVSAEAEAALRAVFTTTRERFLEMLEANYAKRTLNEVAVSYPRFERLVVSFQTQSKTFPINALARLWALGASDQPIQTNLLAKLRETMRHHIQADTMQPEERIGPAHVKMLPLNSNLLDLALMEKQATNFFRTNMYVLSRAREELVGSFPEEEQALANFVASFVKENCILDLELTRQSHKKGTEEIWAADEYDPGQVLVKAGDVIDTRIKAVLDQLRDRAAKAEPKREVAPEQKQTQTEAVQLHEETSRAQMLAQLVLQQNRWLLGGIAVSTLSFLVVLWRLTRWKRSQSLLPARVRNSQISNAVISCPSCASSIVLPLELAGPPARLAIAQTHPSPAPAAQSALAEAESVGVPALREDVSTEYWRERALAAERRVEKNGRTLQTALLPHLARWLMNKVVRGLVFQRAHLLETQQRAEQELAQLEQRLASVQAPLEERLKAYEQRIVELEKDLLAKGEENQELIKATIAITKRKLRLERSKDRLTWN